MEHGVSKTIGHIQIKIKMPNPSQKPPASSKSPNGDIKDIDVLCTFRLKLEGKKIKHGLSKTSHHIQIKIKMPNPSQKPTVSSTAQNDDIKDMDVLCTLKVNIEK